MKHTLAHQLVWGTALFVGASQGLFATDMTTAKSLQKSAQTSLDSMKSGQAASPHGMVLQAQKTTADLAVQAHETAVKAQDEATKAQKAAEEWTSHAQTIAQTAQKISGAPATVVPGDSLKSAVEVKGAKRFMGK